MKILVVPLAITVAVIAIVWLIYPAYSNGVDGLKENYAKLKSEQKKLNDISGENKNIENLSSQISSLPQKDILYSFIPENAEEENIINGLNRLASESGLLLFEATIKPPVKSKTNVAPLDSTGTGETAAPKPEPKNVSTEMKLAGDYLSIKNFLTKLGTFSRSNDVNNLDIEKNSGKNEILSGSGALLVVDASANFSYLSKSKLNEASVFNSVFSNPDLDSKIIEDIKNQKISGAFQLSVGQKGRSNLFQ